MKAGHSEAQPWEACGTTLWKGAFGRRGQRIWAHSTEHVVHTFNWSATSFCLNSGISMVLTAHMVWGDGHRILIYQSQVGHLKSWPSIETAQTLCLMPGLQELRLAIALKDKVPWKNCYTPLVAERKMLSTWRDQYVNVVWVFFGGGMGCTYMEKLNQERCTGY